MSWKTMEVRDGVARVSCDNWRDFVAFVQEELLDYKQYIFRGHRDASWKLVPSLYRLEPERSFFALSLNAFKNATRGRRGPNPSQLSEDEWWALGQHHGLMTPLLDWTLSPFVAAFFAFQHNVESTFLPKDRAVFALARYAVQKKTARIEKEEPGTVDTGTDAIAVISPQVDDNSRLISQSGLFTKSLGYTEDIEKWVQSHFSGEDKWTLIKITITENDGDRGAFLKFLNRMNISHLTLFPDLDGAARYCNMEIEITNY